MWTMPLIRQCACLAGGPLIYFLVQYMPPWPGMTDVGLPCLGAALWLLIWWVSETVTLPAASLLAIPLLGLLGVMPTEKVYAALGSPAAMLILGSTLIVGVWKESNLIERYAYWCFSLPFIKNRPRRIIFIFAFGAGIMSAIAPNLPLVVLFVAVAVATGKSCKLSPKSGLMRSLMVMSAVAPMFGGAGTPIGGGPNIVAIGLIAATLGHTVTFWEWSMLGMPIVILGLLGAALFTFIAFPTSSENVEIPDGYLKGKLKELGPVTVYEHAAIWLMVTALFLWCAGPQLFTFLGFERLAKVFNTGFVAMLMGAAAFILPIAKEKDGKFRFALNWEQANRNIGWDIMTMQIGALAFGFLLLQGGIDKSLAHGLSIILGEMDGVWVWLFLVFVGAILGQLVISFALIPLLVPLTVNLAQTYGFPALAACLSVSMAVNLSCMFPFASVAVAVVMNKSDNYASRKDFIWVGLVSTLVMAAVIFGVCWLLGPVALGY